jgi:hypothetical protein
MQHQLIKIFQKAKYEPDPNLASSIWRAIVRRDKRLTQFKSWTFGLAGFISLAGLVPAFKILSGDLAQSGFYEYFSLLFSDSGSILSHWKELFFSLAESLPATSIVLTLSLLFVCLLSLRYLMKQIGQRQTIFTSSAILST